MVINRFGIVSAYISNMTICVSPKYYHIGKYEHCSFTQAGSSTCVRLGQDQLITSCNPFGVCNPNDDPSGKEVGTSIGSGHRNCGEFPNSVTCTVTHP
jgi:hypothetical protein